jgi:hypothetical protein
MTSQSTAAWVTIGTTGLLSAVVATSASGCGSNQSYARCEEGQAVYRRSDDTEILRLECASDEQCVELSPKQAVCRLFETCQTGWFWSGECQGDALIVCNPEEQFRERIDCVTENHGKPVPGRCAPDTRSGADCVDRDAVRCDFDFQESCSGDERQLCRDGYTSWEAACNEAYRDQGGTCRLNAANRAVCAQPEAAACFPDEWWGTCDEDENAIIRCRGGFVWRERCPEGQRCIMGGRGDVYEAVCE